MTDKRLFVFDKQYKRIIGKHNYWKDTYTLSDNWKTFDSNTQKAIIIDKTVPELNSNAQIIQPVNFDDQDSNEYTYVDISSLPEIPIEQGE